MVNQLPIYLHSTQNANNFSGFPFLFLLFPCSPPTHPSTHLPAHPLPPPCPSAHCMIRSRLMVCLVDCPLSHLVSTRTCRIHSNSTSLRVSCSVFHCLSVRLCPSPTTVWHLLLLRRFENVFHALSLCYASKRFRFTPVFAVFFRFERVLIAGARL